MLPEVSSFLIDVNLPRRFAIWNSPQYLFQQDLDPALPDHDIWKFAKAHSLTIVTKDSDFSSRILLSEPPPRVIHIRLGNMSMRAFHTAITERWASVLELSQANKLVAVHHDRIECVQ